MPSGPAHADPAPEPGDPLPASDWMSAADWEAWCDATAADDEPPASGEDEVEPDPEPGSWTGAVSGFAADGVLDALPGGMPLAFFASNAAGDDGRYAGVSDNELDGVIAAWGRQEAYACARKHAAVAEFIRRRAEPDAAADAVSGMPQVWDEFAVDELRLLFAENRGAAEDLMSRAHDLAVKLPETMVLFLAGRLPESRVKIIVYATAPLDPAEARAADRPGELGGIGPVDPWLARDLARAAARNPKTTWCVTVTDGQGHAVAHGCGRAAPKGHGKRRKPGIPGGTRDGPTGFSGTATGRVGPGGFSFTPEGRPGPPGGHGTWRLCTPGDRPDLIIELYSLGTEHCDHQFEAKGHDPGSSSGTWPRSGMPPVLVRSAGVRRRPVTSSTTSRTEPEAGHACATRAPGAGMTTGSSSTRDGRWTSFPAGRSGGRLPPGGAIPPSPPATRSESGAGHQPAQRRV
jgi:hypothetical protein